MKSRVLLIAMMGLLTLGGAAQGNPSYGGGFARVPDATVPPFAATGVLFVKFPFGRKSRCTATAIDSPSRTLVLTAAHCLYMHECAICPLAARQIRFIPAYDRGRAPFGVFRGRSWRVPRTWREKDFSIYSYDVAAIRTLPNASGEKVADAVGGGVRIATNKPRRQTYQLLGYPGGAQEQMHQCKAKYSGDDPLFRDIAGLLPFRVGCYMGDGASGGPFLIESGSAINGVVSYSRKQTTTHTFSPYFSKRLLAPLRFGL